jgi:putative nucleotidyltransferase with HDIG domain
MRALLAVGRQRLDVLHPPLVPATVDGVLQPHRRSDEPVPSQWVLRSDPLIAAQALVVANGMAGELDGAVASIGGADEILGEQVAGSLLRAVATAAMELPEPFVEPAERLAGHSLAVASLCRHRAARAGVDPDEAWTAGLLHDLGRALLLQAMVRMLRLPEFLATVAVTGVERFLDHPAAAALGVEAARRWNLPDPVKAVLLDQTGQGTQRHPIATLVRDAEADLHGGVNPHRLGQGSGEAQTSPLWSRLIGSATSGGEC